MTNGDKLLKIINHYGVNNQQRKFQEEVFELNEAILEYKYDENKIYPEVDECLKGHIAEEIADVMVMLEQFRLYYGIPVGNIKEVMEYKVKRQIERIKNEKVWWNRIVKKI